MALGADWESRPRLLRMVQVLAREHESRWCAKCRKTTRQARLPKDRVWLCPDCGTVTPDHVRPSERLKDQP